MKSIFKPYILSLFSIIYAINSFGQDVQSNVCTPKGNPVIAYITAEDTDYWRGGVHRF